MEKRYQVFVSSTFADLVDERRAVMQALLELNCIPAGMELFPATSDDQWTLIQRVIDDCDYYLVIVGGRYGSVDEAGVSYTEREYDYALQKDKPVMGFVHDKPGDIPSRHTDHDPMKFAKLDAFRTKIQKRHCKFWNCADDLGGKVSRAYVHLLKTHPAEGWVKYRYAKTTEDLEKVNQMHEQIRILEQEVARLRQASVGVSDALARGQDRAGLNYRSGKEVHCLALNWDDVFGIVGRSCLDVP
jgi:hypothetical protein